MNYIIAGEGKTLSRKTLRFNSVVEGIILKSIIFNFHRNSATPNLEKSEE